MEYCSHQVSSLLLNQQHPAVAMDIFSTLVCLILTRVKTNEIMVNLGFLTGLQQLLKKLLELDPKFRCTMVEALEYISTVIKINDQ